MPQTSVDQRWNVIESVVPEKVGKDKFEGDFDALDSTNLSSISRMVLLRVESLSGVGAWWDNAVRGGMGAGDFVAEWCSLVGNETVALLAVRVC